MIKLKTTLMRMKVALTVTSLMCSYFINMSFYKLNVTIIHCIISQSKKLNNPSYSIFSIQKRHGLVLKTKKKYQYVFYKDQREKKLIIF